MVAVALSSAGVGGAGTAVGATRVKPHRRQLGLLQVPVQDFGQTVSQEREVS